VKNKRPGRGGEGGKAKILKRRGQGTDKRKSGVSNYLRMLQRKGGGKGRRGSTNERE